MKAAVYSRYGPPDVVQIKDVEKPVPKNNEVLIKVRAASVNPLDRYSLRGTPYIARMAGGLCKPKDTRLGFDVAGQVEAVGRNVTQFRPGDEVFGMCRGAFAEYVCTSELALAMKPEKVTFEQAASAPVAAFTALQGLRDKGQIQPGQKVLINGAAGGVGTFAVQIAKWFGAEVTGVCSTRNVEMVRSIGADRLIDYKQAEGTSEETVHRVIDAKRQRLLAKLRHPQKYQDRPHPPGKEVVNGESAPYLTLEGTIELRLLIYRTEAELSVEPKRSRVEGLLVLKTNLIWIQLIVPEQTTVGA